jgi:hypothetical protein
LLASLQAVQQLKGAAPSPALLLSLAEACEPASNPHSHLLVLRLVSPAGLLELLPQLASALPGSGADMYMGLGRLVCERAPLPRSAPPAVRASRRGRRQGLKAGARRRFRVGMLRRRQTS